MVKSSGIQAVTERARAQNSYYFGEEMSDGRLTADYNNVTYNFREMIKKRKEVGRLLSEEETAEYELG